MKDRLVEVRVLAGNKLIPAKEYRHEGKTYIEAKMGRPYAVEVRNLSAGPVEVILSVDGLDILDRKVAGYHKPGFVIGRYRSFTFNGFRLPGTEEVASFMFGALEAAYATLMDAPDNVGVIGIAVFQEQTGFYNLWPDPEQIDDLFGPLGSRRGLPTVLPTPTPTPIPTRTPIPERPMGMPTPTQKRATPLGTVFGERLKNRTVYTSFERLTEKPAAVFTIRYEDRASLEKLGIRVIDLPGSLARREEAQPFPRYIHG